jgi:hypothetical protein
LILAMRVSFVYVCDFGLKSIALERKLLAISR